MNKEEKKMVIIKLVIAVLLISLPFISYSLGKNKSQTIANQCQERAYFIIDKLASRLGADKTNSLLNRPLAEIHTFPTILSRLTSRNYICVSFKNSDLSKADLHGMDLKYINFAGSDFRGANLENADFTGCDLTNADFADTNLKNTILDKAKLKGANFKNAVTEGTNLISGKRL